MHIRSNIQRKLLIRLHHSRRINSRCMNLPLKLFPLCNISILCRDRFRIAIFDFTEIVTDTNESLWTSEMSTSECNARFLLLHGTGGVEGVGNVCI